ncbi:hypothetical protein V8F06_010189 [Rhypophila decipiens]
MLIAVLLGFLGWSEMEVYIIALVFDVDGVADCSLYFSLYFSVGLDACSWIPITSVACYTHCEIIH